MSVPEGGQPLGLWAALAVRRAREERLAWCRRRIAEYNLSDARTREEERRTYGLTPGPEFNAEFVPLPEELFLARDEIAEIIRKIIKSRAPNGWSEIDTDFEYRLEEPYELAVTLLRHVAAVLKPEMVEMVCNKIVISTAIGIEIRGWWPFVRVTKEISKFSVTISYAPST